MTSSSQGVREFPTINRFAIVLEPTEVYLAWAKRNPEGIVLEHADGSLERPKQIPEGEQWLTLEHLRDEVPVYLIPQASVAPEAWLQRNHAAVFEHQLRSWCRDETVWPEDRSFKNFKRFFRVRFHSIVIDTGKDAIVRDTE